MPSLISSVPPSIVPAGPTLRIVAFVIATGLPAGNGEGEVGSGGNGLSSALSPFSLFGASLEAVAAPAALPPSRFSSASGS